MGQNSTPKERNIWAHIAKKFAIIIKDGVRHTVSAEKWKEYQVKGWKRVN